MRTGHAFLDDIAHTAVPTAFKRQPALPAHRRRSPATPIAGDRRPAGTYDNELLDAHYIAGDGRVNENIGLTAVHHVFHSEHNRLVEQIKDVVLAQRRSRLPQPVAARRWRRSRPGADRRLDWNGERLFQAAKFGTEMQYQHLVFEEFARKIQPQIDMFVGRRRATTSTSTRRSSPSSRTPCTASATRC